MVTENEIAGKVIGLGIEVHKMLGPGLLESAYKECLYYKLIKAGLYAEKEKPMPLVFENVKLNCGYRIDILVENKLVIEVKSIDALNDIHLAQTLTYMKLGDYKLGLLINFNVVVLKNGIKRVVNGLWNVKKITAENAKKRELKNLQEKSLHKLCVTLCDLSGKNITPESRKKIPQNHRVLRDFN